MIFVVVSPPAAEVGYIINDGFFDGTDDVEDDPPTFLVFIVASKNGLVLDKANANGDGLNVFFSFVVVSRLVRGCNMELDGSPVNINRDAIFKSGCMSGPIDAATSCARSRCCIDIISSTGPLVEEPFFGVSKLDAALFI